MKIEEQQRDHLTYLRMENDHLLVEFLPEIGGKMTRLRNKITGREFLLPSQASDGRYRIPEYGDLYENYDTSGFDDCFPTIEACQVRESDGKVFQWPDHGEVWALEWDYHIMEKGILFSVTGKQVRYELTRLVSLHQSQLTFHYKLKNQDSTGFHYLWAAHPLIRVVPGSHIVLPEEVTRVLINWATPPQLGEFGELKPWPVVNGRDLSRVQDEQAGIALKCFTDPLKQGVARITFPDSPDILEIGFEAEINPYLGIWITYGGWPGYSSRKHLTVGLEPTSGRPDSLEKAMERGECQFLTPGGEVEWNLYLRLESASETETVFQDTENLENQNAEEVK